MWSFWSLLVAVLVVVITPLVPVEVRVACSQVFLV
jgi:hypothetical protein